MLPLPLTLATARRRWHQDFEAQCHGMPCQVRTRTHPAKCDPDGNILRPARTERYHVQPKPAPTTAKDLMTDLVFLTIRALERHNRAYCVNEVRVEAKAPAEVPAISVNCKQLGKRRSLSSRTIRTHLDLLLKMGAIARKVWHGTRANFELWINPKYLWESSEKAVEMDLDGNSLGALLRGKDTKLPLNVSFVTLETQKREITNGDKLATPVVSTSRPRFGTRLAAKWGLATPAGNTGPQLIDVAANPEINFTPGASGMPNAGDRPSKLQQRQWVLAFWAQAQPRLYPGSHFTEAEHTRVLNVIWKDIYGGFGPGLSAEDWALGHAQNLERIELVAGWLARHPGRYLPAPYAEIVAGRGYFDAGNLQGFVHTREWLAKKMHSQRVRRIERALRRAAAELQGWRSRKAPARVLDLTLRQLIQLHRGLITAFDDPAALNRFLRLASGFA